MPTLSLCMIVKNEEQFLEPCLNSVNGLVDEIIIVDTGSTDKTKEIAAKFTDKIFDFEWCDDFSAARNASLKYATGNWILILDADEVIAKEDHAKIKTLFNNPDADGYILLQRNYFKSFEALQYGSFGKLEVVEAGQSDSKFISSKGDCYQESSGTVGWMPIPIVRLFKNNPLAAFSGVVHEDVSPTLHQIASSDVPIHHYGKLNLEVWKKKWELYEKLGEKKAQKSNDYYAYFELGRQYLENRKIAQAQEMLVRSIKLNNNFWNSWFNLGSIYLLLGKNEEALICLEKAKALNPSVAAIYTNLGVIYVQKKELEKAAANFLLAIQLNLEDADTYFNLGLCFNELGRKNDAYAVFKQAIALNPEYGNKIKLGK